MEEGRGRDGQLYGSTTPTEQAKHQKGMALQEGTQWLPSLSLAGFLFFGARIGFGSSDTRDLRSVCL